MKAVIVSALALVALVPAVACKKNDPTTTQEQLQKDPAEQDRAGVTTITGATWVANDAAMDRVVASRCAREITCTNIGPDKHFVNGEQCLRELRKSIHEDLKVSECPSGIDGQSLDTCLDAIRGESCSNPLDTVSRLAACRTGALCMKSEMPKR